MVFRDGSGSSYIGPEVRQKISAGAMTRFTTEPVADEKLSGIGNNTRAVLYFVHSVRLSSGKTWSVNMAALAREVGISYGYSLGRSATSAVSIDHSSNPAGRPSR